MVLAVDYIWREQASVTIQARWCKNLVRARRGNELGLIPHVGLVQRPVHRMHFTKPPLKLPRPDGRECLLAAIRARHRGKAWGDRARDRRCVELIWCLSHQFAPNWFDMMP